MALRYITGRSGTGENRILVRKVIRRSIEIPEKQYYVIVPEQFSLEMQRKIVKMHPRHGFFNIDVLSFHVCPIVFLQNVIISQKKYWKIWAYR